MKKLLLLTALVCSLQGCVFAVGAAAGAAGVAMVYDHRKVEQVVKDQRIANGIAGQIHTIPGMTDSSHIAVSCFNEMVLLTGQTITPELRQQAEEIAVNYPGVKRVYNQISVKGPTSSLTRTSDSWITTKIKTQMLATEGLKSGSIKVVTENGTVYLMGVVTHRQAEIAVDIARDISGVQKVVKIFQYTDGSQQ